MTTRRGFLRTAWRNCAILTVVFLASASPVEAGRLAALANPSNGAALIPSWQAVNSTGAPPARYWHTAVWTGAEMIVWGGIGEPYNFSNTGGRYNPSTDSWTLLPPGAPSGRVGHTAVWTGSEMIVWGGWSDGGATKHRGPVQPGNEQLDDAANLRRSVCTT